MRRLRTLDFGGSSFRREGIVAAVCTALVLSLVPATSEGQLDAVFEFDGDADGTSWDEPANWERVLDPDGLPVSGDPVAPPDPLTSAELPLPGVTVDGTMAGQTALDVRIGTAAGSGSLGVAGSALAASRDVVVGRDDAAGVNTGALAISGGMLSAGDDILIGENSAGTMTMTGGSVSTGDDFFINSNSGVDVAAGMIAVGDRLSLQDDATLAVHGGTITVGDDAFFFGDSQITVNGGLIEIADKLRFDDDPLMNGRLTINGGVVRSNEFGESTTGFRGVVEINDDGVYQVEAPGLSDPFTQLSVADAMMLIADGIFFTSSTGALQATSVIVPDFFGDTDVAFTQISVAPIPEPTSAVLLGMGLFGMAATRRRAQRRSGAVPARA